MKENVTKLTAGSRRADRLPYVIGYVVALSFPLHAATAGPLDLDTTFNNGTGKVVTDFQLDPQDARDVGRDIAVQQDGKIIAVGSARNGDQGYDFAVVRYKPNGSIDQAIQIPGLVHTDFDSTDDEAYAVAIQPGDSKIVVAGYVQDQSGESKSVDFALARYNPDLTLDQGFGNNGLVRTDFGAYEAAFDLALQPDGKIVVAGHRKPTGNDSDFLIARYMPDGSLDASFGEGGKVITDFGAWDIGWAVEIQNDSKIVVVGSTWGPNFQPVHGALARYNPNGTLDQSFTHGLDPFLCLYVQACGKTKVTLGGGYPVSLALRKADGTEDGKIVVAGQFGVARLDANGALDETFGNAGIADSQDNLAYAVAIEANGDIVVAGTDQDDFVVEIYKPTGKRCSATTTDFKGDIDEALATTIQPDGKILVLGHASLGPPSDFALARYVGGNCLLRLSRNFLAYHVYIPPYELIGPPIPLDGLRIGQSEQLALPATDGGAFSDTAPPGYQAFKLVNAERENSQTGAFVTVTNSLGESLLEVLEPQQVLVPTDFAAGRAGRVSASGSRSAPLLKCYDVKMPGESAQHEKKPVTVTDALTRSWTFELGEAALLCKPIDSGESKGQAIGLVGYQLAALTRPDSSPASVPLPTVNALGAHILQVGQPELLFLLSLVE